MKKIVLSVFALLSFNLAFANADQGELDPIKEVKVEIPATVEDVDSISLEELANLLIRELTGEGNASIDLPAPFDPYNGSVVFEWWMLFVGLLTPIITYLAFRFFPAINNLDLYIRSASIAIICILIVIFMLKDGVNMGTIGQAIFAFVLQAVSYKSLWKGLGLQSKKSKAFVEAKRSS